MACESWPRSLNTSDWRLAILLSRASLSQLDLDQLELVHLHDGSSLPDGACLSKRKLRLSQLSMVAELASVQLVCFLRVFL